MHPILLRAGPFTLYTYGAMIALGFLTASWAAARRARRIGLDPAPIQGLALTALIFGILGARAAYVLLNWPIYRSDWMEILRFDHGGLIFYGGFFAGAAGVVWRIRRQRLPGWSTADLLVPPFVLAHAFGRLGCFLNGCCYGKPTSVPWAVPFPGEGIPRHPTALYEMAFLLLLFAALKRMESAQDRGGPAGRILLTYGLAYGLWRFAVEFLRGDNPEIFLHLTVFQLASAALVLASGAALIRMVRPSTHR